MSDTTTPSAAASGHRRGTCGMIDTQPDIGEPRRTYGEALADADLDMLLYGSIYVIRNADGMYQRVSPRCITVHADA